MVKSPILLEMGVLPAVAGGTVATMILFTSATSTLSLLVLGLMPKAYGIFFFVFGIVCSAVGGAAISKVLVKHKKQSVVVLSIGLIISVSVVTMGIQSALRLVENPATILNVGSLCSAGTGE